MEQHSTILRKKSSGNNRNASSNSLIVQNTNINRTGGTSYQETDLSLDSRVNQITIKKEYKDTDNCDSKSTNTSISIGYKSKTVIGKAFGQFKDRFSTNNQKKDTDSDKVSTSDSNRSKFSTKRHSNGPKSKIHPSCEIYVDTIELSTALMVEDFVNAFMDFCISEHSEENLEFWLRAKNFREIVLPEELQREAKKIYETFIEDNCEKPINIDSNAKNIVLKLIKYPNNTMFEPCEEQIYNLMKRDTLTRFLRSPHYRESTKNLPCFSEKNVNAIQMIGQESRRGSEELLVKSRKMTLNVDKILPDVERLSSSNSYLKDKKFIIMPRFDEKFNKERNSVLNGIVRIVINERNYTLPVNDGTSILQLLHSVNLANKDFSSFLAFLHPCKLIIELSQNSAYYSAKTIEMRKYSKVTISMGSVSADVRCPYEAPIGKVIETVASRYNIAMDDFMSIKYKGKKPVILVSSSGNFDKLIITCTMKKKQ